MNEAEDARQNNFGFLRLLFAAFVLVSHSWELDGQPEFIGRIFGTTTIGSIGVAGFFLVSGYLITKSFVNARGALDYLMRRVLRIYPAFIVACLVCTFGVAPIAGGQFDFTAFDIASRLYHTVLLHAPFVQGSFAGLRHPSLNGSMWTIAYEFRCYLLVIVLGYSRILNKRIIFSAFTAVLILVSMVEWKIQLPTQLEYIFGEPYLGVRLTAEFCTGAMFYIWRDKIILKSKYAFAAVFGALLSLTSPITVVLGLVLFGGYLVFWFALKFNSRWITGLGSKNDVSYGLYLYAFPIQNLLIWHFPGISPLIILLVTLPCSLFIGYVSWIVVEKPALKLKLLSKDISQTQTTQHPSNSRHTRAVPAGAATGERLGH